MSFIENALRNHNIVMLLMGMLVAAGIVGLFVMPKQEMPPFTIRQGAVVAVCPGMSSSDIEQRVARDVENFVFSYKEVNKKKTYSESRDGMLVVYVQLGDEVNDRDAFWSKLKHGLTTLKASLPQSVIALQAVDDIADTSALLITIESGQKTYRELNTYLNDIKEKLRRIDAISNIRVYGLRSEQITVLLDQNKMAKYGIGATTMLQSLQADGFTMLSGRVEDEQNVAPVYISDPYVSELDIERKIVYSSPQGQVVRLGDVATVSREYPRPDKYITNNGHKCVLLSVEMKQGNDIVKMGSEVKKVIADFVETVPGDVKVEIITDQSHVVSESVVNFLRELLISVIAVILTVVLLMPRRVAGVSALSIPITIFISVGLFFIFGMELNTVTLAALIVTLGMVVDDSVVIIDNYMEKLGNGMSRWQATIAAPREFFMSVLSATLSISLTFFPFLITMKGDMGDFVRSFPWAMFIILTVSLSVSLLLTPFLQYTFIKQGLQVAPAAQLAGGKPKKKPLDYLQDGYSWLLKRCFSHPYVTLSVAVALIALGALIFGSLPQRMMPIAERNQFAVEIYLPDGASARRTAAVADSLEHILKRDSRVTSVTSFIGQGSPRFQATYAPQMGGTNFAQFIVNTTGNEATQDVLDEYADKYTQFFPDANIRFKQMDYNNAASPLEIRVSGDSLADIMRATGMIEQVMRQTDGISMVRTDYGQPLPAVGVTMREPEASQLGVNKALLSASIALRYGQGVPATTLWEGDYPVSVVLKTDHQGNSEFAAMPDDYIPVMGGTKAVPLRQLVDIRPVYTYGQIVRRNGTRTVTVMADLERGRNANAMARTVCDEVEKLQLPDNVSTEVGGMAERDAEAQPQVYSGVLIAVFIIFFILLFHFKRISMALVNLSAMSLCIFGAAVGLLLTGFDVSMTCILGVVSLMGILVRNGIIMLDYAEELRKGEGMPARQAAFQAGERRMRPIFLTSAAASVGVLPMMLEGDTLWSPMASVIFFGTLISMILIATVLPVLYWLIFRRMDGKQLAAAPAEE